jgi:diacylglycerol kinase family enzyme
VRDTGGRRNQLSGPFNRPHSPDSDSPNQQTPPRSAVLVVNARSRKGQAQLEEARSLIGAAGIRLTAVHSIGDPGALQEVVANVVADRRPMLILGGGDGSLLTAVGELAGTSTVLGVLPLGTANSFARALGIPLDLAGAVDVIAHGRVRNVDLGVVGETLYAGCASIGLAPQIAQSVPHGLKAWAGRPGYLVWAAGQLARFKSFRLTITSPAGLETMDAVEVRIANGPFHGGVELVDTAELESGQIVVQAVTGEKRRPLVLNWLAHMLHSKARGRQIRQFEGTSLRIETDPPLPISIDGEVLARTPVTVGARARALWVTSPRA